MKIFALPIASVALVIVSGTSQASTLPTGVYSGKFGDGKATLFIDTVGKGRITGTSLYKHNKRPLTGTISAQGNFWQITLNEPATRTGDGQFDITASRDNPEVLIGTWKVFPKTDTKAGITAKSFNFNQTQCQYNKNNGYYTQASNHVLDDGELYIDPADLEYMRNEIFARHGYSFKSSIWANTFSEQDWYVPCATDVSDKLTSIELQNIKRIKQTRAYMLANPQTWGR